MSNRAARPAPARVDTAADPSSPMRRSRGPARACRRDGMQRRTQDRASIAAGDTAATIGTTRSNGSMTRSRRRLPASSVTTVQRSKGSTRAMRHCSSRTVTMEPAESVRACWVSCKAATRRQQADIRGNPRAVAAHRSFCRLPAAIAMLFLLPSDVDCVEEQPEGGVRLAAMLRPEGEQHRAALA